jgi:hypothetical protein
VLLALYLNCLALDAPPTHRASGIHLEKMLSRLCLAGSKAQLLLHSLGDLPFPTALLWPHNHIGASLLRL